MNGKVALYLQDAHDLRDGLEYVRYAEEKGFDAVWQAESRLVRDAIVPTADKNSCCIRSIFSTRPLVTSLTVRIPRGNFSPSRVRAIQHHDWLIAIPSQDNPCSA